MIELQDHETLSQYGNALSPPGEPFRCRPRHWKPEHDVSLIRGRLTVDEIAVLVNPRRPVKRAFEDEGVRYTTVGRIRAAGFRVEHTPSSRIPDHVSVTTLDVRARWTDDESDRFAACFTDAMYKKEEGRHE